MKKKGALELSVNAIVIIIIAVVVLGLALGFVRGVFGGAAKKIAEQVESEQDPVTPTANNLITFSRENVKTSPGATEIVKISVLNPTNLDWTSRPDLYQGFFGCNAVDNVCYVSDECDGISDSDCLGDPNRACDSSDGVCLLNDKTCPAGQEGDEGQDCAPRNDGVSLLMRCNNELQISKISLPLTILSGEIRTFTSVIQIKGGVKGKYLCETKLFGDGIENMQKDITIEVI